MTSTDQLTTFCKKLKLPTPDTDGCAGITGDFGGAQVVWVDLKQKTRDLVDTVIHEAVHVHQHFLTHIGETHIGKESQAYGIAYIATTLLEELERQLEINGEFNDIPGNAVHCDAGRVEETERVPSVLEAVHPEIRST